MSWLSGLVKGAGSLLGTVGKAAFGFAKANPYVAASMALGAMGMYGQKKNKPKNIDFDFRFQNPDGTPKDLALASYSANPALTGAVSNLNSLGGQFRRAYTDMLNPASAYNQRQFDMLRRNVGDTRNQTINSMNAALAARGMMGASGIYDSIISRQAGDQFAQGQQNIMNTGANLAGQFGGMSLQAFNNAGSFANQIDSRTLSNEQFNVQNQNTYDQYLRQSMYNQMVQNQNAQAAYRNSSNQNFFNLAGSVIGAKPLPKVG